MLKRSLVEQKYVNLEKQELKHPSQRNSTKNERMCLLLLYPKFEKHFSHLVAEKLSWFVGNK